jgi:hypothetical protein
MLVLLAFTAGLQAAPIWRELNPQARGTDSQARLFQADEAALRTRLNLAPHETLLDRSFRLELPMPDGSLQEFSVVDSPIMDADLAGKFPHMRTFRIFGIDDAAVSGRADLTHKGFRVILRTSKGLLFIDRETGSGQSDVYKSSYRKAGPAQSFSCGVHRLDAGRTNRVVASGRELNRIEGLYQTYRIAVSATSEYVAAVGGSSAAAQAEILTAINRVNMIYERDLGIRLLLVANDGQLIEKDIDNCFSNNDSLAMLGENQVWIDSRIGNSAYDIGHVFSTDTGGLAFIGSACQVSNKAQGVTGQAIPLGDPFYIDYVAHEIGHQLNADHSFNGTTNACGGGNRWGPTAFEPGSGSTIMGYTNICGAENLQSSSDATFHAGSISQIDAFTGAGGSCYNSLANGNNDPAVTPLIDATIPANTPFRLDVSASDVDVDPIVYQWDQMDSGDATDDITFGTDLGNNPLFRTYEPQSDSWRDFPALGTQVLGQTDDAEVLPNVVRALNFRVTVRDDASGQAIDDILLTVAASTGFRVTSQAGGGTLDTNLVPYTITWDRAGSDVAPINCATVDIDLLTFSDASYTTYSVHPIVAGVTNNDSVDVGAALPNSHPRARIRVSCSNNIFYDISDADLDVVGANAAQYSDGDFTTFFNSNGLTVSRSTAGFGDFITSNDRETGRNTYVDVFASQARSAQDRIDECGFTASPGGSSGRDSSAIGYAWLLLLGGLAALRRVR